MLKAALEKANMTDISIIQQKLRVSHNDLVLIKQHNSELKDRVQLLESRLFDALNSNTVNTQSLHASKLGRSKSEFDIELKALQSKNNHLLRLNKSYENRMKAMQAEIDTLRESEKQKSVCNDHTLAFHLDSVLQPSGLNDEDSQASERHEDLSPEIRKIINLEVRKLSRKLRERDLKTINELAREVKRLTVLIPRRVIDGDVAQEPAKVKSDDEDPINEVAELTECASEEKISSYMNSMPIAIVPPGGKSFLSLFLGGCYALARVAYGCLKGMIIAAICLFVCFCIALFLFNS
jgi:hypothetical protein